MTPLDDLLQYETFHRVFRALSPDQLLLLWLRVGCGLNFQQLARHQEVSPAAITHRMNRIAERVTRACPDLAYNGGRRPTIKSPKPTPATLTADEQTLVDLVADANTAGRLAYAAGLAPALGLSEPRTTFLVRGLVDRGYLRRGTPQGHRLPLYLTGKGAQP